ncbi:hypothetical protein RCL1_008189 [Eukaryota sp. TZLM3-RCL]
MSSPLYVFLFSVFVFTSLAIDVRSLPGLEKLATTLNSQLSDDINISYQNKDTKLIVKGQLASNVVRIPQFSTLESLSTLQDGDIVTFQNNVLRAGNCLSGKCSFERAHPLSAYTSLSFTYETARTKNFDFSWNFDTETKSAKDTIHLTDSISLPDTYFHAASSLTIDFAFNVIEGVKKCEARLVSQVDLSVSISITNSSLAIDQRIANILLGTYTIPLFVPIPITPRLVIDFVGSADVYGSYGASFVAKNELIKQTVGFANDELYFSNDFGTFSTSFTQFKSDSEIQISFSLRASVDLNVAGAMSVNVSLVPRIDGQVNLCTCPGTAFLDVDFSLDRAYGISDIGYEFFGKFFGKKVAQYFPIEALSKYKLLSRCQESQTLAVVSESVPQTTGTNFWLQITVTGSSLDQIFLTANGLTSDYCDVSQDQCTFSESYPVSDGSVFTFALYKTTWIYFRSTLLSQRTVTITSSTPLIFTTSSGQTVTLTPISAHQIEPNKHVTVNWDNGNSAFFQLTQPFSSVSSFPKRVIMTSDDDSYSKLQVFGAKNVGDSNEKIEVLNQFPYTVIPLPQSRYRKIFVQCSIEPTIDVYLDMPDHPHGRYVAIDKTEALNWQTDYFYTPSQIKTQSVELKRFATSIAKTPSIFDVKVTDFSNSLSTVGSISNTGTLSNGAECALTAETYYPSVYLSVDTAESNKPFTFVYSDVIDCNHCCLDFSEHVFYYFDPSLDSPNVFFQISGQWSNIVQDSHISSVSIIARPHSVLLSNRNQNSCVFKYFLHNSDDLYQLSLNERLVLLVEAPAYTVTTINCPDNMKWVALKLAGDFWELDELLPEPHLSSTIQFNNQEDLPIVYAVIYSCGVTGCVGVVPSASYSRRMVSGIPFHMASLGLTSFSSTTQCLRGDVYYNVADDVAVRIDVPSSSTIFSISGNGMFTVDHQFSEFIIRSSFENNLHHWGTFSFSCVHSLSSSIVVPPHGTVTVEYQQPLLSASPLMSSLNRTGFVKLADDNPSAFIVGSIYSGKNSVLFIDNYYKDTHISVSSFGQSVTATFEFIDYEKSHLVCTFNQNFIECNIIGMNQFSTAFADPGAVQKGALLVDNEGKSQEVDVTNTLVLDSRRARVFFSSTVLHGSFVIHGSALTLTGEAMYGQLVRKYTFLLVALFAFVVVCLLVGGFFYSRSRKVKENVPVPLQQISVNPLAMRSCVV